jgi:hypothetical protein
MNIETLVKALEEAGRQRKLKGDPLYRCKVGDRYIGFKYKLVKRESAITLFTDDLKPWLSLAPVDVTSDELSFERVHYRKPKSR